MITRGCNRSRPHEIDRGSVGGSYQGTSTDPLNALTIKGIYQGVIRTYVGHGKLWRMALT